MKKFKISLSHKNKLFNLFKNSKKKKLFKKNKKAVLREFNQEKYDLILKKIKINKNLSINDIDEIALNLNKADYFFYKNNIIFDKRKNAHQRNISIFAKVINKLISPGIKNNIVELGAGYGSKILNLKRNYFQKHNFYGFDISRNSIKILNHLKKKIEIIDIKKMCLV